VAQCDRHDAPWLIDELVPRLTAMVDEIVVGFEDAMYASGEGRLVDYAKL
jgi:hypothetical protein